MFDADDVGKGTTVSDKQGDDKKEEGASKKGDVSRAVDVLDAYRQFGSGSSAESIDALLDEMSPSAAAIDAGKMIEDRIALRATRAAAGEALPPGTAAMLCDENFLQRKFSMAFYLVPFCIDQTKHERTYNGPAVRIAKPPHGARSAIDRAGGTPAMCVTPDERLTSAEYEISSQTSIGNIIEDMTKQGLTLSVAAKMRAFGSDILSASAARDSTEGQTDRDGTKNARSNASIVRSVCARTATLDLCVDRVEVCPRLTEAAYDIVTLGDAAELLVANGSHLGSGPMGIGGTHVQRHGAQSDSVARATDGRSFSGTSKQANGSVGFAPSAAASASLEAAAAAVAQTERAKTETSSECRRSLCADTYSDAIDSDPDHFCKSISSGCNGWRLLDRGNIGEFVPIWTLLKRDWARDCAAAEGVAKSAKAKAEAAADAFAETTAKAAKDPVYESHAFRMKVSKETAEENARIAAARFERERRKERWLERSCFLLARAWTNLAGEYKDAGKDAGAVAKIISTVKTDVLLAERIMNEPYNEHAPDELMLERVYDEQCADIVHDAVQRGVREAKAAIEAGAEISPSVVLKVMDVVDRADVRHADAKVFLRLLCRHLRTEAEAAASTTATETPDFVDFVNLVASSSKSVAAKNKLKFYFSASGRATEIARIRLRHRDRSANYNVGPADAARLRDVGPLRLDDIALASIGILEDVNKAENELPKTNDQKISQDLTAAMQATLVPSEHVQIFGSDDNVCVKVSRSVATKAPAAAKMLAAPVDSPSPDRIRFETIGAKMLKAIFEGYLARRPVNVAASPVASSPSSTSSKKPAWSPTTWDRTFIEGMTTPNTDFSICIHGNFVFVDTCRIIIAARLLGLDELAKLAEWRLNKMIENPEYQWNVLKAKLSPAAVAIMKEAGQGGHLA
jgi:hypothetical protein